MSQPTGPSPDNTSNQTHQMPFEPSCDFDQVYEQWLAGPPSSQQTVTPDCPASTTIDRIDSGIDVWDDQGPQNQSTNDGITHQEELSSHAECPNPAACELSPDMASTMRRFAVPHNCAYLEAKNMLVDKVRTKFSFPPQSRNMPPFLLSRENLHCQ